MKKIKLLLCIGEIILIWSVVIAAILGIKDIDTVPIYHQIATLNSHSFIDTTINYLMIPINALIIIYAMYKGIDLTVNTLNSWDVWH